MDFDRQKFNVMKVFSQIDMLLHNLALSVT